MSTQRYIATDLKSIADGQERSIAWLARKCNVSYALMNYITRRERTASHEVAQRAADVLGVPLFLAFESTSVKESTADMERVA